MYSRNGPEGPDPQLAQDEGVAGKEEGGGGDAFLDPYRRLVEVLTVARLWLAQGRTDSALALLGRLLLAVARMGQPKRAVEIHVLRALALYAQGETHQAVEALEHALPLGAASGYVRIFLDEGPALERLLHLALPRSGEPDYVRMLLAEFAREGPPPLPDKAEGTNAPAVLASSGQDAGGAPQMLHEPLSERERQVLRLLTTHMSSTDIAHELYLSPNTVRTHIKRIYGKLDVHSRGDAVERARQLGLLG